MILRNFFSTSTNVFRDPKIHFYSFSVEEKIRLQKARYPSRKKENGLVLTSSFRKNLIAIFIFTGCCKATALVLHITMPCMLPLRECASSILLHQTLFLHLDLYSLGLLTELSYNVNHSEYRPRAAQAYGGCRGSLCCQKARTNKRHGRPLCPPAKNKGRP
jgi:hypothetical protein